MTSEQLVKDGNIITAITGRDLEEQDNKVMSLASLQGHEQKAMGFTFYTLDCTHHDTGDTGSAIKLLCYSCK